MFKSNDKKKSEEKNTSVSERNRVSKNTVLKGDITSDGDFRIDGKIEGNLITTGKVIVGEEGEILGNLKCQAADVEGKLTGVLEIKNNLVLRSTARVNGEAFMGSLQIEPGAIFNANCEMLNAVKELNPLTIEAKKTSEGKISKVS